MKASDPERRRPEVSVIIPARNEEASLGACLESIVGQQGIDFELIVVDDGSNDRTREIALSYRKVRVLDAGPLPSGWTGKNNALVSGSKEARGEWLLFTDADTVHLPGSLAHSVKQARQLGAALFSYSPEQEVHGAGQHAVMPVIFAELAAHYRPRDVCNPELSVAAANGQYLLISREAYEAVGGHAAIATEILEDVALAKAVKASGRRIVLLFGRGAVQTRMYRTFAQLREGWTKNLALLFPRPVRLAWLRLTEFVTLVAGASVAVTAGMKSMGRLAILAGIGTSILYFCFLRRILKAHFGWASNALAIFGLPVFAYLLLRSQLFYQRGQIEWKGRRYTARGMASNGFNAGPRGDTDSAGEIHQARGL